MIISIVAAVSQNMVIGKKNQIPWHIPTDLKWFKTITNGKPIIMGRKTFESIGKPLDNRRNIVITQKMFNISNVETYASLVTALDILRSTESEVMIIGGEQIYKEAINMADQLFITHIEAHIDGDVRFPDIDPVMWRVVRRELPSQKPEDEFNIEIVTYERLK